MFRYGTLSYAYAVLTTYLDRLFLSQAETERRRRPKRRAPTDQAAQRVLDSSPIMG